MSSAQQLSENINLKSDSDILESLIKESENMQLDFAAQIRYQILTSGLYQTFKTHSETMITK